MRYFVPELALGVLMPPQTSVEDKFGGLPFGLAPARWPSCAGCGKPLTHLATLMHDPERLNLGASGRVVMVFQCNHDPGMCNTWDAESGAKSVVVLEAAELTPGTTPSPEPAAELEPEARVRSWVFHNDDVTDETYRSFFSDEALSHLKTQVAGSVYCATKLGSVPCWIQGAEEGPNAPFLFAAQFDCVHTFTGPIPGPSVLPNSGISPGRVSGTYTVPAANYGDAGMGYLFLNPDPDKPEGKFFWQCG